MCGAWLGCGLPYHTESQHRIRLHKSSYAYLYIHAMYNNATFGYNAYHSQHNGSTQSALYYAAVPPPVRLTDGGNHKCKWAYNFLGIQHITRAYRIQQNKHNHKKNVFRKVPPAFWRRRTMCVKRDHGSWQRCERLHSKAPKLLHNCGC